MSFKKIIIALLAVAMLPCSSMQVDAAKPKKKATTSKTTKKSSSKKSTSKKSSHSSSSSHKSSSKKKTVEFAKVRPVEKVTTTENNNESLILASSNVSSDNIIKTAMQYIGVPYKWGASSEKGFDCSGFTSYVYKQYDIKLHRTAGSQYSQGKVIKDKKDLKAGDLVFFQGRSGKGGIGHVGIVIEAYPQENTFKFIHARNGGVGIDKSSMSYYNSRYVGACRILNGKTED